MAQEIKLHPLTQGTVPIHFVCLQNGIGKVRQSSVHQEWNVSLLVMLLVAQRILVYIDGVQVVG
jgi:hypothetical protein